MSNLSAFLKPNAEQASNVKFAVSSRFKDEAGNPVEWELKTVTGDVDEAIRKSCAVKVPILGKNKKPTGQYRDETDSSLYIGKLTSACVVFPDLNSAELQNSYGVYGADALLKVMLLPGEYVDLTNKIQEINGYTETMDDLVDEAKNSSTETTVKQV